MGQGGMHTNHNFTFSSIYLKKPLSQFWEKTKNYRKRFQDQGKERMKHLSREEWSLIY